MPLAVPTSSACHSAPMAEPGLREIKRLETERRLAATAHALVTERGFDQVTVDDIVARAHVSRRTFSNYYSCKEEAVAAVVLHDATDALARWQRPAAGDDDLIAALRSLIGHQFAAGVLTRLADLTGLCATHKQLIPHVHAAQWGLWEMAGESLHGPEHSPDPRRRAEVDAVLGAVFGVITSILDQVIDAAPGQGPDPARIHQLMDHVLDRLEHGFSG